MPMKLRDIVRSPQRLEQDPSYNPMPQKKISKKPPQADQEEVRKPQFIDFNPNLPPAAFPTLDTPRLPTHHAHAAQNGGSGDNALDGIGQGDMLESLDHLSLLTNPDDHSERSSSPARDIPMGELDNAMASNGNLNTIWMSNMARIAAIAVGEDVELDTDMDDSDSDAPPPGKPDVSQLPLSDERVLPTSAFSQPSTEYLDPSWTDLSQRMQAEIFGNLLQSYSPPAICRMLRLTPNELDAVYATLESRHKQIELEDTQLEAMRARQFRELARVDNSPRVQSQSHQLVFRKASRQTFRGLRDAINPEVDFFACEESEHNIAKSFLRRREIEAMHAGSWGNDVAHIHNPEEDEERSWTSFGLDGGPGPNPISGYDFSSREDPNPKFPPTPPTDIQEAFLNWLGGSCSSTTDDLDYRKHYGKSTLHPRWHTLFQERTVVPEQEPAAKKRMQQFDLIKCYNKYSSAPSKVTHDEPLDVLPPGELERRYRLHMLQRQLQCQLRIGNIIRKPIVNGEAGPFGASTPPDKEKMVVTLRYSPRGENGEAPSSSSSSPSFSRRPRPFSLALPDRSSTNTITSRHKRVPREAPVQAQIQTQRHKVDAGHHEQVPVTDANTQSNINRETDVDIQTTNPILTGLVKTSAFIPLSPATSPSYHTSSTQQTDTEMDTEMDTEIETDVVQPLSAPSPANAPQYTQAIDETENEEEDAMQGHDDDEMVLVPSPNKTM
ncbi:hypothetical protein BDV06DRAFT_220301 [Aspergillus oleicola]